MRQTKAAAGGLTTARTRRTRQILTASILPGDADLVLLDGDPVADRAVLRRPAGVMVAGRWLDRARLDALLQGVALAASRQGAPQRG